MSKQNSSAFTDQSLETLFTQIGSTLIYDTLWAYLSTSLAIIGFFANLLSFYILFDERLGMFRASLYQYLRVYTLNSAMVNFLCVFIFVSNSYRILPVTNTFWAQAYFIYIFGPLFNTGYFYGAALDALMTWDRIVSIMPSLNKYMKLTSNKISLTVLFLCTCINISFFFVFTPLSITQKSNLSNTNLTVWLIGPSHFSLTFFGTILTFTVYSIRDGLLLLVIVILNIVSICLLKDRMNKKTDLQTRTSRISSTAQLAIIDTDSQRVNTLASIFRRHSNIQRTSSQAETLNSRQAEQKLSIMVIYMCLLSSVEHGLIITACVYPIIDLDPIGFHRIYFFSVLSVNFKHAANLFLFVLLNKHFKKEFLRKLKAFRQVSQSRISAAF